MVGHISKRAVDALKRRATLWDDAVRGFVARRRAGAAVVYAVKFRAGGRQRWYRIGTHGSPWTPDTARAEALRLLAEVGRGHDPAAVKLGARTAPTVGELVDRFLSEHAGAKLKPSTAREYRKLCNNLLRPALGPRRVADVTRADLARLHHAHRGTPTQANRMIAMASKMFTLAERWGLRPDGSNPCRNLEKFKQRPRERFLTVEEFGRLGAVLAAAERGPIQVPRKDGTMAPVIVSPFAVAAVRLLALLGARSGEILNLEWAHVDLARGCLRLPDSKTGQKVVHLNTAAVAVLEALPHVEGTPPYVLPGARAGRPLGGFRHAWGKIRAAAGLSGVRPHDLRHSFASVGVGAAGLNLPLVGALLGHTQASTTQRYSHLGADPVKAAAEAVGARVAAALEGGA